MKKKTILVLASLFILALTLSGCADFSFNPIGRWRIAEERYFENDVLISTREIKESDYGGQTALVFKKTGTGYIDSGAKNKLEFTYEYTDSSVSIKLNEAGAVYEVGDNGSELIATIEDYDDNSSGKVVHCKRKTVFKK